MTPDDVMGMLRTGHLTREQALVHIREMPGMGPVARMIIEQSFAQRGQVYELPAVVSTVRPTSVSSGPSRPYPHDEDCDRKHQPMTPCRPLHEMRPGWHSLADMNPDGSSRIPGGPVTSRLAPASTVIGECRGCRMSQVLDGGLCSYCAELAGLKAASEKAGVVQADAYAWPWPLSVRSFLTRFWLVFALLAIGALIGVLG